MQKHTKTWFEVASGPPGSPRPRKGVTSGSLWGHRARPDLRSVSLRGHFAATWLAETSARGHFGVTSRSSGSRRLGSRSLRGHLAQENLARSHFEVAATAATADTTTVWRLFKKTSEEHLWKPFKQTSRSQSHSASLRSARIHKRMDILGLTLVYIYIYKLLN